MSSPLPPLPGETPEQRQARLNAAYEVQARIDAERRAELETREQARRREMQARIERMLGSAYALPPLPQLPTPEVPIRPDRPVMLPEVPVGVGAPVMPPLPTTRPDSNAIPTAILTAEGYKPNPAYTADVAMQRYRTELPNSRYYTPQEIQQIMGRVESAYAQPGVTGAQISDAYRNASIEVTSARNRQPVVDPAAYANQPPAPVIPPMPVGVRGAEPLPLPPPIPTHYDPEPPLPTPVIPPRLTPVMPPAPVVAPPELRPPAPTPMETLSSAFRSSPFFAPSSPDDSQPTQPSLGMSSLLAPQPALPAAYTPPMEAPVPSFNLGDLGGVQDAFQNPPSMRLGAGMPRMDYTQNFYAVNPNEVAMYKMGGLAVKPKKGKC